MRDRFAGARPFDPCVIESFFKHAFVCTRGSTGLYDSMERSGDHNRGMCVEIPRLQTELDEPG